MADKRQPHLLAADPRRRRVGVGVRRPPRTGPPLPPGAKPPAQHFSQRFRRHAIGIEKLRTVEMIGHRPGIGFHSVNPDRWHAYHSGSAREQPQHTTAGDVHGPIGLKTRVSARGEPVGRVHETAILPRLFLTFGGCGGLTSRLLEKTFFSTRRPALEAGGQRPTARCALGRKSGHRSSRHHPRRRVIQYPSASRLSRKASEYWIPRLRGV